MNAARTFALLALPPATIAALVLYAMNRGTRHD